MRLLLLCALLLMNMCKGLKHSTSTPNKNINDQFIAAESFSNGEIQNNHDQINPKCDISQPSSHCPNIQNTKSRFTPYTDPSRSTAQQVASSPILNKEIGSNFPSLSTASRGQSSVKQIIEMYNNRDEETRKSQMTGGNKDKPLSYSSVVAGNKKQTDGNPNSLPQQTTVTPHLSSDSSKISSSKQVTDNELKHLSETLLLKDSNNVAKLITVNYQGQTSSSSSVDQAPLPLFIIPSTVWNITTVRAMRALLDNYEQDVLVNEYITPMERNEETVFLDAIMETAVMRYLMTVLKEKGIVTPDPRQQRDYLKQIWFNMYSRGQGKIGSSGFEHIFLLEIKNNQISGLHSWLYFAIEEAANRANYLGYMKKINFADKGAILKFHFKYNNIDKPVDSMFIGTSPELEIALYTLCFALRADTSCPLSLGGKYLTIRAYTYRYRSKNMIGSAYPEI